MLFEPIPVVDLELTSSEPVVPNASGQIWALVRRSGRPVGKLALWDGEAHGLDLRSRALQAVEVEVDPDVEPERATTPAGPAGLVGTVVLCTLGTEPRLRQAVASVLAQSESRLELVVVDNAPASGSVRQLLAGVDDPRLRIVDEPVRGLSAARNAGLAAARADVVAYTDDDAVVEPDWLRHLVGPFSVHADVACVTGLVVPAELETQAQVWFEEFGGFDKGFVRTVWSMAPIPGLAGAGEPGQGDLLFPYAAGSFGSGNNMAFRTAFLRSQGGFDEALGAGSATRGGEDLDAFLAVMFAGKALVYEPCAVVRHFARRDVEALRTQLFGYGSGMSAVIAKHFFSGPRRAGEILARLPAGVRWLLDPESGKNQARTSRFPDELRWEERRGYLAGPALYVRARRESARRRAAARSATVVGDSRGGTPAGSRPR